MMLETNPARIEVGVFDHLDDSGRELGRQYLGRQYNLLRQIDDAGVNYVMFLLAFGDLSLADSLRTVAGVAAEIAPAIREMEPLRAPRG